MKFILLFLVFIILIVGIEVLVSLRGKKVVFQNPSSSPRIFGKTGATTLTYLVLGDSTTAGVGGDYEKGIAVLSAKFLAQTYQVTLLNTSVSGAVTADILQKQLPRTNQINPDIVLISVGANDVTHITRLKSIQMNLGRIIALLKKKNCNVKIVLTGAAAVYTSPRFYPPLSLILRYRTKQVNTIITRKINNDRLTLAPIANKTGPIFQKDRTLFAPDNFHPNDRGYAVWTTVINKALLEAINRQPSHC